MVDFIKNKLNKTIDSTVDVVHSEIKSSFFITKFIVISFVFFIFSIIGIIIYLISKI